MAQIAAQLLAGNLNPREDEIDLALHTSSRLLRRATAGVCETVHAFELFKPGAFLTAHGVSKVFSENGWDEFTKHFVAKHLTVLLDRLHGEIQANLSISREAASSSRVTIRTLEDLQIEARGCIGRLLDNLGLTDFVGGDRDMIVESVNAALSAGLEKRLKKLATVRLQDSGVDRAFFEETCEGFSYETYLGSIKPDGTIAPETLRNLIWGIVASDSEKIPDILMKVNDWIFSHRNLISRSYTDLPLSRTSSPTPERVADLSPRFIAYLVSLWSMLELEQRLPALDPEPTLAALETLFQRWKKVSPPGRMDPDQRLEFQRLGQSVENVRSWLRGERALPSSLLPFLHSTRRDGIDFEKEFLRRLSEFRLCVDELQAGLEACSELVESSELRVLLANLSRDLAQVGDAPLGHIQTIMLAGEKMGLHLLDGIMNPDCLPQTFDAHKIFKYAYERGIEVDPKVRLSRSRSTGVDSGTEEDPAA